MAKMLWTFGPDLGPRLASPNTHEAPSTLGALRWSNSHGESSRYKALKLCAHAQGPVPAYGTCA